MTSFDTEMMSYGSGLKEIQFSIEDDDIRLRDDVIRFWVEDHVIQL